MTLTSDTLLGLAWYTFATCCSRRVFYPLLLNSERETYGLYNYFTRFGSVISTLKHVVITTLPVLKNYGCNISRLAFVRGMLVRSENRWLYRDVTRQTKNCYV